MYTVQYLETKNIIFKINPYLDLNPSKNKF